MHLLHSPDGVRAAVIRPTTTPLGRYHANHDHDYDQLAYVGEFATSWKQRTWPLPCCRARPSARARRQLGPGWPPSCPEGGERHRIDLPA
ncbi:hypothetical protein [Streptomyces luteolus]|uniref:Uncharacterized protein n=1 Tax=Streptomyces luteolus TaxID=3043615 RepID=A0ABT6T4Y6_9ACTN|nr:hypothetical protein [Streptomyces sp. B-S-A12]MDI3422686.1 hypothetical protein [Streptomyces sp. B-S-A12]